MNVNDIVRDAAETVGRIPRFSGVPVLEEDKGNIVAELGKKIAQQNACAVVGWNGFSPKIGGVNAPGETPFGTVTIVVQVFEKPAVNRRSETNPRLLDLAQDVAIELDGAASEGMDDTLHLSRISPIVELDGGIISCDIEFTTSTNL